MQKIVKVVMAVVIAMVVVSSVQMFFMKKQNKIPNTIYALNSTLPKKVDEITTFTKIELDGKILRFHYVLTPGEVIDPDGLAEVRAQAVKGICASEVKEVFDDGISIELLYAFQPKGDTDKKVSISILPDSCK